MFPIIGILFPIIGNPFPIIGNLFSFLLKTLIFHLKMFPIQMEIALRKEIIRIGGEFNNKTLRVLE